MASTRPVNLGPQQMQAALQSIAQGGGPAAQTAQQLLASLQANPNLANDPGFAQAVQQAATADGTLSGSNPLESFRGAINLATAGNTARQVTTNQAAVKNQIQQQDLINQITGQAQNQQDFTNYVVMPSLSAQKEASAQATLADMIAFGQQGQARDRAVAQNNNLVNEQRGLAGSYNTQSRQLFNDYSQQQNALNAQDQGTLSRYMSETDPLMTMMRAQGSDPNDVARQLASYNQLSGVGSGSLDYQAAQAALSQAGYTTAGYTTAQQTLADYQRAQLFQSALKQYASNPEDVQGQKDAIAAIKGDLAHGGDDQRDAMLKYKALTSPEVTAQERFLAETARRSFESQDRSNREAVLQDLALRGMRSGGAEIASALANQERLGQDRTLAELGLQANAVGRSMQALQGYSQSASNLRNSNQQSMGLYVDATGRLRDANDRVGMFNTDQANTVNMFNTGQANQNAQFNANAYNQNSMFNAGEANRLSMFNADAYNQNQQFNANAYNTNQMFNAGQANQVSMFNAGQTNNAYANNQATRLSGIQGAATQSNAIRSANDSQRQFQDMYAQAEAARVGGLATNRANTSLLGTANMGGRNDSVYQEGSKALDTQYGRDKDSIKLATDANTGPNGQYVMDSDVNNALSQMGSNAVSRAQGLTTSAIGASGINSNSQQAIINALGLQLDANSAEAARKQLRGW